MKIYKMAKTILQVCIILFLLISLPIFDTNIPAMAKTPPTPTITLTILSFSATEMAGYTTYSNNYSNNFIIESTTVPIAAVLPPTSEAVTPAKNIRSLN